MPHVAATSTNAEPMVWAVDAVHSPAYWFPRQCPRALAWVGPETSDADRERILSPGRTHVLDNLWAFWEDVVASSLGFGGIRLRSARPAGR